MKDRQRIDTDQKDVCADILMDRSLGWNFEPRDNQLNVSDRLDAHTHIERIHKAHDNNFKTAERSDNLSVITAVMDWCIAGSIVPRSDERVSQSKDA